MTKTPDKQMSFDMTHPCTGCPFLKGPQAVRHLGEKRAREIANTLLAGSTFPCHKTTKEDEETGERITGPHEQMCAGAMLLCEKTGGPNTAMIYARLLGWWRSPLDYSAAVYDTWDEFAEAQK